PRPHRHRPPVARRAVRLSATPQIRHGPVVLGSDVGVWVVDHETGARSARRTSHVSPRAASVTLLVVGRSGPIVPGSKSLPLFDRSGSVHAERLKQQGRLFSPFIFEMLTSTRRLRVSGFFVALTQRTHSQRAIG